jgi:hypothetical protein
MRPSRMWRMASRSSWSRLARSATRSEFVVGAGEGSAGCGFDDEVVDGHVEGLGEADEHVDAGGDAFVFVAADALAVGAEAFAELGSSGA